MSKAVISNRIYFKYKDSEHLKSLMNDLTYRIEVRKGKSTSAKTKFSNIEIIKGYKLLPGGIISIPQGRQDLIPEGYEILDKRVIHEVPFPEPKYALRDSQQPVYDEVNDTCFINALVGWGKTFTALHLAKKLGQKTLVITHTTMLRDQWVEEIKALYGISPGIIGSGQFDIEDQAIVVGNVQTVTKHITTLSKEFGTLILDEAHHCPATTFTAIVDGMHARYRIALSGTMTRTDGKHVIFKDYFGPTVIKPPQSHTLNPVVKIVPTGVSLPSRIAWSQKINMLLYDTDYQDFIANVAKAQAAKGHSVLIVADRVEFLEKIKGAIGESCVLITGKTTFEERKALIAKVESKEVTCVAGSRQIFAEGISINVLSCVILPVPSANPITLEQIVGRIMRLAPNKLQPVVMDMNFSSTTEKRQDASRLAFYVSKGWKVEKI